MAKTFPSDRALGELGALFGLLGIAGVGVPMIWPDQKVPGVIFVSLGITGFFIIGFLAIRRMCSAQGVRLGMMLSWVGIALIISGAIVGFLGAFLHDTPLPPSRRQTEEPTARPILEATDNSTIDASGADLRGWTAPFARADKGSLISMSDIKASKLPDGRARIFEDIAKRFPPPTGEFSKYTKDQLLGLTRSVIDRLETWDVEESAAYDSIYQKYADRIGKDPRLDAELAQVWEQRQPGRERLGKLAQSVAAELLTRVPPTENYTIAWEEFTGYDRLLHAKLVGPHPGRAAAQFLGYMSKRVAEQH